MPKLFFLLLLIIPNYLVAQHTANTSVNSFFSSLEIKDNKEYTRGIKQDSAMKVLVKTIRSTGNPYQNLSFQFTDSVTGFVYGNELGYGYWPFLFKTTDAGLHWNRLLFKPIEDGVPIYKDNFYMFNKNEGILIYNTNNIKRLLNGKYVTKLQYYLTQDGGKTWKQKSKRLKTRNIHLENNPRYMQCSFTMKGEVFITILNAPWTMPKGKRLAKDRISLQLNSKDFGKSFEEIVVE